MTLTLITNFPVHGGDMAQEFIMRNTDLSMVDVHGLHLINGSTHAHY